MQMCIRKYINPVLSRASIVVAKNCFRLIKIGPLNYQNKTELQTLDRYRRLINFYVGRQQTTAVGSLIEELHCRRVTAKGSRPRTDTE